MQIKSTQAETRFTAPQHLVKNLAYKLNPLKKKTKYLRGRIDTCAEANILQLSVYKLIFKDSDCKQLAPSTKVSIRTYNTDKINIVGSCSLFRVHPDTSKLKQVTIYDTSHEDSVVLSCKTSLRLNSIHPHSNLDQIPDCASLIYSNADQPMKRKSNKSVQDKYVNQCVNNKVPVQDETRKRENQATVKEYDKNCQVNMRTVKPAVCSEKQCQETPNVHMWPVKPAKESNHMQSVTRSSNRKAVESASDKNCHATTCYTKNNSVCSDKNCQDTKFVQPVKQEMNMQSKEPQSSFKKKHVPLCNDKNCQSTRCYRNRSPMRPMYCNDKNCQENKFVQMWPLKPEMKKSSYMQLPKPARKQVIHKNCQSTRCFRLKRVSSETSV